MHVSQETPEQTTTRLRRVMAQARLEIFDGAYAVHPESIKGLYSMLCSFAPAPHVEAEAYAALVSD